MGETFARYSSAGKEVNIGYRPCSKKKKLSVDVSVVTLYNSLGAGANLLMLVFWGKLADRVGNRPIMVVVGILVALTPLGRSTTGCSPALGFCSRAAFCVSG